MKSQVSVAKFTVLIASLCVFFHGDCASADTEDRIARDRDAPRMEQAIEECVEQFNLAMHHGDANDILVSAVLAKGLQPKSAVAEVMAIKAKEALRSASAKLLADDARRVDDVGNANQAKPVRDQALELPVDLDAGDLEQVQRVLESSMDPAPAHACLTWLLDRRVESIDRLCRLTDAQQKKLLLAGRGDLQHFIDRARKLGSAGRKYPAGQAKGERAASLTEDFSALIHVLDAGLHEEGSLFEKTRKGTLTPEQSTAYDSAFPGPAGSRLKGPRAD